eukprot:TRINITY_DN163_c0_g1_i1.p1 TRINITY_DN163_c0_g1~~TRINITY_DN163_c0_g1_i1.p1  ORF type:complete len:210 (+),score=80.53 TRINITY_DN163_c0_g1_i1:99-728(+)
MCIRDRRRVHGEIREKTLKQTQRRHKMAEQTQKAFQKQDAVFLNTRQLLKTKTTKGTRYYKNVGLGFKTPKEAIEGGYIDKKCPFTGNVNIRGKILKGMVISTKMTRTIIIRRDYLHYVPKYNRFEKRHKNIPVHCSPAFSVKEGDIVTVGQCRPLSKTVRFNVLKVTPNEIIGSARKQFMLFQRTRIEALESLEDESAFWIVFFAMYD